MEVQFGKMKCAGDELVCNESGIYFKKDQNRNFILCVFYQFFF